MPASRRESCGRCNSERISDPARTSRLKLSTRPAITASGRASSPRDRHPAGPSPADPPRSGPSPAGRALPGGAAAATSTTGRTGRMQGEIPARNPATMPTRTSSTMPPPPFPSTAPVTLYSKPKPAASWCAVLRISGDGSLRLVPGGVVSSGGVLPVSVAVHDNLVYVANAGNGGSNYTGFRLRHDGRLKPVAGSTVALPDGSQPGDVLFNADGSRLAGTRIGTSLIDSFAVGDDGRLAAAPGS